MNHENVILISGLTRVYKMGEAEVRALDGIDLTVARGEFLGLVGASGSGKSTLLNLIAGLDSPTSGKIMIDGQDLAAMNAKQLAIHRRYTIGMVFQSFNLISSMTAFDNVQLPLVFAAVPQAERQARTSTSLIHTGLQERSRHRPSQMSGGEQQRTAIARALINQPKIFLADEPTGNLDSKTSIEIMELLRAINEQGTTTVLVTHNLSLAEKYCTRIIQLSYGKLVE